MSDEQKTVTGGPGRSTRRAVLAGAGAVGATVVLAACGTDSGDDDTGVSGGGDNTGTPDGGTSQGGDSGTAALTRTGDVPVGGGRIFAQQDVVVVQPTAGEFKAFSAICTHQGCPVTSVDGGTINCACHNSKFSITDGSVQSGPATRPLGAKNIKVDGDNITLA